jgi:hypothetical protein
MRKSLALLLKGNLNNFKLILKLHLPEISRKIKEAQLIDGLWVQEKENIDKKLTETKNTI